MKEWMLRAGALGFCCCTVNAHANFACKADPSAFLGIDAGGTVLVTVIGTGRVKVCNLELEQGGITARTCAGWYSTFMTARMARTPVTLYFDETNPNNGGSNSCTTLGEWTVRVPYYIEFQP
jgi:hypothetical protein